MSARTLAAAAGLSALLFVSPASAGGYRHGCSYAAPVYASPCAYAAPGYGYAHHHYVVVKPYYIVNQGPTYSGPYPFHYPYEYHGYAYRTVYAPAYYPPRWIGYNTRLYRPYRPRRAYYGRAYRHPRHMYTPYAKTPIPPVPRPRLHRKQPIVHP